MFRFYTETESFDVSIELKQTEDQPNSLIGSIFWYFFQKVLGFSGLFRFVLDCFEIVCFGCFASLPKQRVSMFRLDRNKQKTNRNSLIESIFCYFSENLGLFRFVSKQFCLFQWFRYRFEIPKQTEIFSFWFYKTNRNTSEADLFRYEPNFFLILRTPYLRSPFCKH